MFLCSGINKVLVQYSYTPTPHIGNLKSPCFIFYTCITQGLYWQVLAMLVRRAGEGCAAVHASDCIIN